MERKCTMTNKNYSRNYVCHSVIIYHQPCEKLSVELGDRERECIATKSEHTTSITSCANEALSGSITNDWIHLDYQDKRTLYTIPDENVLDSYWAIDRVRHRAIEEQRVNIMIHCG